MPRQSRFLPPENVFHIMCRGNNGNSIFLENEDYFKYLELVTRFKSEHPFELYHYLLMPNHVHHLIQISSKSDYSNFMKRLNLSYFCYYRNKYGWSGHFWQDRFKSLLVSKDEYLIQCGKYIELNPVKAGLVAKAEDWPWSSYQFYAKGQLNYLITTNPIYDSLGAMPSDRQIAYQEIIKSEVFEFDNKTIAQGSKTFIHNVKRREKYHKAKGLEFHNYPSIRQTHD